MDTPPPACGDNIRNQPFEVCDGTDLAAQTCQSLGLVTGALACATDCLSFNVSGCPTVPTCGDGIVNQPGESCDLSDLRGVTCQSLSLGNGLLRCSSDCNLDTSQCEAASFEIDNKGREFIVGFMLNYLGVATAQVHLTSDAPTSVTVQYPVNTPSFSRTVAVTPGQVTVVDLPSTAHNNWFSGQISNNAVRVSGPDDFGVYLVNRAAISSDAGTALPIDALGTSYIVTTFSGGSQLYDRSQFLLIAPFDATTVTITPAASIPYPQGEAVPHVPIQLTLNRGQGFFSQALLSDGDLTGTLIESDRPITVLNSNRCTYIPSTVPSCDHIFEVAQPLQSWGTSALVVNLPDRPGGSIYRVIASVDGTEVMLDGVLQTTLDRGQFFEAGPLPGSHVFTANHPIFVTQFMTGVTSPGATSGDPAMVNVIPPDQYVDSYTFSTVGEGQFNSHFLTLITPNDSIGSVLLDGAPIPSDRFVSIAGTSFSSALLPLVEGSHTTSSSHPHGITVTGLNVADSYSYSGGGARVVFINQSETLDNFLCYRTKSTKGDICAADAPLNVGAPCITEEDCGGRSEGDDGEEETDYCVPNKFPRGLQLTLDDAYSTGVFDLRKPVNLCNPAEVEEKTVEDLTTHVRGFQVKLSKGQCSAESPRNIGAGCKKEEDCGGVSRETAYCTPQPKFQKRTNLRVKNPLHPQGELKVDLVKPDRLFTPAAKDHTRPLPPPSPTSHHVDNYACYRVKVSKGAPKFPKGLRARVVDQFDQEKLYDLKRPTRLCAPTDVDGSGIKDETTSLMCYQARPVTKVCAVTAPANASGGCKKEEECGGVSKQTNLCQAQPKHSKITGLFVSTAILPEQVDTIKEDELCVPSEVISEP